MASEVIAFVAGQPGVLSRGPGICIRIPKAIHNVSIEALVLSTRARNALLFNGIRNLGQLDGLGTGGREGLRLVGPTWAEITQSIFAFLTESAKSASSLASHQEAVEQDGDDIGARVTFTIPDEAGDWPVGVLRLAAQLQATLHACGVSALSKLATLSLSAFEPLPGVGASGLGEIQTALGILSNRVHHFAPLPCKPDPMVRRVRQSSCAQIDAKNRKPPDRR